MNITIDSINLQGSILGEVLDADYLAPKIGEPVNLHPTNYCTAMWNGIRCDGTHDQDWGYSVPFHSVRGEEGRCSMWRDGYGGIILQERPYIEELDVDLGWSELDRIHAEENDVRAGGVSGATGTVLSGLIK